MLSNNKNQPLSFSAILLVFFVGALGFSQLSNTLTLDLLRLPVYFPEPFFLLLILLVYKGAVVEFRPRLTRPLVLVITWGLATWTLLVLLAVTEGSLFDALSTGRPYLYAFIAALFGGCLRGQKIEYVFTFLIGVAAGELVNASIAAPHFNDNYRGIAAVNLIGLFSLASIVVLINKKSWLLFVAPLLVSLVFLSGFRVAIATLLLGLLIPFFIRLVRARSFANAVGTVMKFPVVIITVVATGYVSIKYFLELHQFAYFRTVHRTMALLSGDIESSQDGGRVAKFMYFATQEPGGILPSGFVMRTRDQIGDFNDVPFLNFTVTFGVPFGIVLIIFFLCLGSLFAIKKIYANRSSSLDLTAAAFVPFFVFLLLINGRFAYIIYESVLLGFIVGYCIWSLLYSRSRFIHNLIP